MTRVLIVLAVAALALAACGGAAAPSGQAPAATAPAGGSAATSTAAAPTAASGPNIADVLKAGKATTYKATYKWSTTAGGQTIDSEQTWYYKAPNSRFDFSAGPGASFSIFSLADGTYLCTSAGGTSFCPEERGTVRVRPEPGGGFRAAAPG